MKFFRRTSTMDHINRPRCSHQAQSVILLQIIFQTMDIVLRSGSSSRNSYKFPMPTQGFVFDTLVTKHEIFIKTWKTSKAHEEFRGFFINVLFRISCMCLCLRSLTADWPRAAGTKKYNQSMSQLITLESWIEFFSGLISLPVPYI